MPDRYQYKVVEVRERMIGGKMSGEKLEKLLNEHASQGWQLKAITSADVRVESDPEEPKASLSPSNAASGRPSPQTSWQWPSVHPQPAVNGHRIVRCSRLGQR